MPIGSNFIGELIGFFIKANVDDPGTRGARFSYRNRAPNWNSYVRECFGSLKGTCVIRHTDFLSGLRY